ncbi:helix-turn-helix transcriptional regulator [Jeongeupia naejangsanensis]|uniref:Helix-turn-helix transcriptional regulator n=1 Tax=Jeongeupia naejangsanensis TaxID=613195 RepID=A0ABS2BJB1_9NEIS|nr:helix-turn-helix transcriptional regulator [Jeongeupia naejangsanensis]MBM3115086.1 helix-turn-helix transcriptional regulator [Jeongeupia naejangsanensis]
MKMQALMALAQQACDASATLPFSVYSSVLEQRILNAPIAKPLLIFVLAGVKTLGPDGGVACPAGHFFFLSSTSGVDMRNIPGGDGYFAVLIELDYSDFHQFNGLRQQAGASVHGKMDDVLAKALQQFVEWSACAPAAIWHLRRKELLQLIYLSGHEGVASFVEPPGIAHRVHALVNGDVAGKWSVDRLASALAMSESTLRRKLQAEGVSLTDIVNRARLGHGLHLLQTTLAPIGRIAERCGYHSQSRFTSKFKDLFGVTPSELRKTRIRN